ncbi:hypothetical protein [Sulfuriferula plumbiphila]|uniref:hypothetical protein n=1 Tax=Sulfuriferula plumbiphila TaxID=171865 RepID=UPI001E45B045|nr:hypothetical protein [Sulfuriferula plumbiphila]
MNTECSAFVRIHLLGDIATHPLARPVARLPLSRLVASRSHTPKRTIGRVQLRFLG